MVHVKLTKKVKKTVDGKEVTVDQTCTAEQSQVALMKEHGWKVVGEKPTVEVEEPKKANSAPKQTAEKTSS